MEMETEMDVVTGETSYQFEFKKKSGLE